MNKISLKGVSIDTWVRTLVLVIILINQIFAVFGKTFLPYTQAEIYQCVSACATVIVTVWAAWKNNSFSEKAQEADQYLVQLKKVNEKDTI